VVEAVWVTDWEKKRVDAAKWLDMSFFNATNRGL
jgi:hypothetical protein